MTLYSLFNIGLLLLLSVILLILPLSSLSQPIDINNNDISSSSSSSPRFLSLDEFESILITDIRDDKWMTTHKNTTSSSANTANASLSSLQDQETTTTTTTRITEESFRTALLNEWHHRVSSHHQQQHNDGNFDTLSSFDDITTSIARRRLQQQQPTSNEANDQGKESSSHPPPPPPSTTTHPYILCSHHPFTSGIHQLSLLSRLLSTTSLSKFHIIYNGDDKTCLYATLSPLTALTTLKTATLISLTPLLPMMKVGRGLFQKWREWDDGGRVVLKALICPTDDDDEEEREVTKRRLIDGGREILDKTRQRMGTSAVMDNSLMTDDELLVSRWMYHFSSNNDNNTTLTDDIFNDIQVTANPHTHQLMYTLPTTPHLILSSLLPLLLSSPITLFLDIIPPMEPMNLQAQWIVQGRIFDNKGATSTTDEVRKWYDAGLTGRNQVIGVSDTGLDLRNCYFRDDWNGDVVRDGRVDYSKRKVIQYIPFADSLDVDAGHGTHVTGTVAGRHAEDGHTETNGMADGIAYDAKIAFSDIGKEGERGLLVPADIDDLLNPSYEHANAPFHSGSWGYPNNVYGFEDNGFDSYTYRNKNFLAIFAAGNYGKDNSGGYDIAESVISPAVGKNVLSVGASESYGPDITPKMLGDDYLSDFSSRGPTADGRTMPDLIAPGYWILSARAQPSYSSCDHSDGITYKKGTSMATPVVSGAAALIRQYFMEGYYPTGRRPSSSSLKETISFEPTGALIKAILLNGATYLKGVQNGPSVTPIQPYDNNQNFGLVDLSYSLPIVSGDEDPFFKAFVYDDVDISDGITHHYGFVIDDSLTCRHPNNAEDDPPKYRLSATLTWMDPPATPNCKRCVMNDLDLFLTKNSDYVSDYIYYPNGKMERDYKNNAERIRLPYDATDDSSSAVYVVSVKAYDLITDSQPYALVVTGCVKETETYPPVPTPPTSAPNHDHSDDGGGSYFGWGVFVGGVLFLVVIVMGVFLARDRWREHSVVTTHEPQQQGILS